MVRKIGTLVVVMALGGVFALLYTAYIPVSQLGPVSAHYAAKGMEELGSANLVTAVVVTYRGLDTLGEVVVLFLAATILGLLLRESGNEPGTDGAPPSEILCSGAALLVPLVLLLGVFLFTHGHLTPGGGFQGGAVMAVAALLFLLTEPGRRRVYRWLHLVESFSGLTYVALGILGIFLAEGFLDNRILPLGTPGRLISAGAIPLIYSLIGLKVGAELAGILAGLQGENSTREGFHG